jgi:acetyl-CoA synthetase
MDLNDGAVSPQERVAFLLARYSAPQASAAYLLCDRHDPQRVAYRVVAPDLSSFDLTYGALRRDSERLAAGLSSIGMRPGDRIATLMGKSVAYLVTVMAIWRLGAVHVPLFTAFAPSGIAFRLTASRCKVVFCDSAQRPKLLPGESMPADPPWRVVTTGRSDATTLAYEDLLTSGHSGFPAAEFGGLAPIIQIYTSGTTGKPKGVNVPLRAVASFQIYGEYGLGITADDVFWNAADPGWAYGLYFGIIGTLSTGARGILQEGSFSPEATLQVLSRYGVTNFTAAPTVYRSLRMSGLAVPPDLQLRYASSAGEPLTPEVNGWAATALGVPVHDHYGQTEAGMLINNHHHPALRRPLKTASMGRAMPGWSAVILKPVADEIAPIGHPGRVAMDLTCSPLAWFEGYVDDQAKSAEKFSSDGRWYFTGDTGYIDADGYFHFNSRDDDVIIMAGYRIGPFEVESVLATHPGISECAVIAAPDEVRGEVLEAVVVLRPGCAPSAELTSELQKWVKRRYAAHAYPRRVHYVESLPKTPSGKIQRFILREQFRRPENAS